MRKSLIIVSNILICVFLGIHTVSSFGVATIYSESFPLRLEPGGERETFFLLSNVIGGDSDVVIDFSIIGGNEIASLINVNNRYAVKSGAEVEVPILIRIPNHAVPGTQYKVNGMFRPAPLISSGGQVQFLVNIGKSFPVEVIGGNEDLTDLERNIFKLTLEEQPEQIVKDLSPKSKGSVGLLIGVISVLILGIIVAILFIIFLIFKNKRVVQVPVGFIRQPEIKQQKDDFGNEIKD